MLIYLRRYFAVIPVLYLFLTVFALRYQVGYVYLAAATMVILLIVAQRGARLKADIALAQRMAVLSAIGLSCAFILSIEKIEMLLDKGHVASCSLSPVVACSPVIASPQASAFGFSNTFLGLFGFAAVLTAGMTLLAASGMNGKLQLAKAWWRTLLAGIAFGAVFCVWLFYQGVFNIGKLCLYCMLVWLVTTSLLWLVAAHCVENKYVNFGKAINKLLSFKYELMVSTFLLIFLLIFARWSDYWLSLF